MGLSIYKINYKFKQAMVEWVAQDESRCVGYQKEATNHASYYIAPSKDVALAHFNENNKHNLLSNKRYEFEMGDVERFEISALLLDLTQATRF